MHQSVDGASLDLSLEFNELRQGKTPHKFTIKKKNLEPQAVALFVDIQAIANRDSRGELEFDIYCDQQEFSVLEYGDQLIPAVAHYIHAQRKSGGDYPCYITDLGLPHDLELHDYQNDLQTVQYLHYKQAIEASLNNALKQLVRGEKDY
jgi:adenylate cyclase class 1